MSEVTERIETINYSLYYGTFQALRSLSIHVYANKITAIVGPSGCGKSTLLRSFNRMNELIPGVRVEGDILLDGQSVFDDTDVVDLRRRVGMVFQKPNPFPKSIFDNVAYGPRAHGLRNKQRLSDIVEKSLKAAALWDEVADDLSKSGMTLSGGQALAVEPEVILMDEPCSALDPASTLRIEELMRGLTKEYTIIIVTHNMQQAARVSDYAIFLMMEEDRAGIVVEHGPTSELFTNPKDRRTEDYITGRFG
jgi:phosphate transport system ATP-binding protein